VNGKLAVKIAPRGSASISASNFGVLA